MNSAERDPRRVVKLADISTADVVLFHSRTSGLAALAASPDWSVVYDDGVWALAGRRRTVGSHPPDRFEERARPRPPTIASFFTPADRERFASYPRSTAAPGPR